MGKEKMKAMPVPMAVLIPTRLVEGIVAEIIKGSDNRGSYEHPKGHGKGYSVESCVESTDGGVRACY